MIFSPARWFPSWPFRTTVSANSFARRSRPRAGQRWIYFRGGEGRGSRVEREVEKWARWIWQKALQSGVARYFVFYFLELHADWTRTLTALVVMLYNALSLSLFLALGFGGWHVEKGGRSSDFSQFKIWWNIIPLPPIYYWDSLNDPSIHKRRYITIEKSWRN